MADEDLVQFFPDASKVRPESGCFFGFAHTFLPLSCSLQYVVIESAPHRKPDPGRRRPGRPRFLIGDRNGKDLRFPRTAGIGAVFHRSDIFTGTDPAGHTVGLGHDRQHGGCPAGFFGPRFAPSACTGFITVLLLVGELPACRRGFVGREHLKSAAGKFPAAGDAFFSPFTVVPVAGRTGSSDPTGVFEGVFILSRAFTGAGSPTPGRFAAALFCGMAIAVAAAFLIVAPPMISRSAFAGAGAAGNSIPRISGRAFAAAPAGIIFETFSGKKIAPPSGLSAR
ncbi:MAG: hypothetical protein IJT50_07940 [Lentisphaeria bacterium]|nr:hypothetical protein [Lentisphaeria bacterium]